MMKESATQEQPPAGARSTTAKSSATLAESARGTVARSEKEAASVGPLCKRLVKNKRNFKRKNAEGKMRYYPTGTVIECPIAEVKANKTLLEGTVAYRGNLADGQMLSQDTSNDEQAADEEV